MADGVRVVVPEEARGWSRRACSVAFDDTEGGLLPVGEVLVQVAALAPGPEAIGLLHGLAGRAMSQSEALRVVELWQPQLAWVTGAEQTALLGFAGPTPDPQDAKAVLEDQFVPSALARALHATKDHAFDRVFTARQLSETFPALGERLRTGTLDAYRVRLITDVLTTLHPAQASAVLHSILPTAAGLSTGRLRKQLRTLARQVDPDWTATMFAKARKGRRVAFSPEGQDGLVGMHAWLPPVEAIAVQHHLTKAAQTGPIEDNDLRDHDERMADALIGAVLGTTPGDPSTALSPDVTLNVFVPLPLLLGLQEAVQDGGHAESDGQVAQADGAGQAEQTGLVQQTEQVGWLEGYGALPVELIRALAGDASWRRWVLEPVTGHLLDLGKHRYKPSPELSEYVRARDRYCRYPGCNRTARRADLDHLDPYHQDRPPDDEDAPGGNTSAANLAAACRHHHRGKTFGMLRVTGDPNGPLTWTDKHGQTGKTEPHNYNEGL